MRAEGSIGIREFKNTARKMFARYVTRAWVDIAYRGQVVAQLLPVRPPKQSAKEVAPIWTDSDQLAAEIGASWPLGVGAADAVREARWAL